MTRKRKDFETGGRAARSSFPRRQFICRGLATAGLIACPTIVSPRVLGGPGGPGANEQVRIAVIGMGARGQNLIGNVPPAGRVTAICDCARSRLAQTFKPKGKFAKILAPFLASEDARRCKKYQDLRRLLDGEKLDAVMVSTPDHNHALIAMLALQRGLDVYLEKPLTLTIAEGRALVGAVTRSRCVLQVGSQQRTMEMNRFACEFIRDGGLGKVSRVDVGNYPGPMREASLAEETAPEGLDWNLFCGPRTLRPYNRRLWVKDAFHVGDLLWRGWDLWRDYSGHLTTNWGAHMFDMVQYALGQDDSGPVEIRPRRPEDVRKLALEYASTTPIPATLGGGGHDDRRFWPVTMRYANGVDLRFTPGERSSRFYGERGQLVMQRNGYRMDPPDLAKDAPDPKVAKKWEGFGHVARPHIEDWLSCVKTRKTPNAPVEVGHRSNTVGLLANIARELGRPLRWDPASERFDGDDEANRLLDRPRREGFELPEV